MCGCTIESFHKGLKATSALYFIFGVVIFVCGLIVKLKVNNIGGFAIFTGCWICITIQFSAWSNRHVCLQVTAVILNAIGVVLLLLSAIVASTELNAVVSLESCVSSETIMYYGNEEYYADSLYCYEKDDGYDCSCASKLTNNDDDDTDNNTNTFNCLYYDLPMGSEDCGRLFSGKLLSNLKVITGFSSAALCFAIALSIAACAPVCCRTVGQCFDNSMVQVAPLNEGPGPSYATTTATMATPGGSGGGGGSRHGGGGEHVYQAEVVDVTASVILVPMGGGGNTNNYDNNNNNYINQGYAGVPTHTYAALGGSSGGGDGGGQANTTDSVSKQQAPPTSEEAIAVMVTATPVSLGYNGSAATNT